MKRSEMVKILSAPTVIDNVSFQLWPSEAEAVLQVIEQAGMLPPEYLDRKAGWRMHGWELENE